MPKCQNCGHQWTLTNTCKLAFKFSGDNGRRCSNCGETQYLSKKSLNRIGITGILGLALIVLIRPLLTQDFWTSMLLSIPFVVVLIAVDLLLVELSNVQWPQR